MIENSSNENLGKDREKEKNDREKTSIFGLLYTTCIQSSKKRRNDLLIGLLKRAFQITQIIRNNNNDGIIYNYNIINSNNNDFDNNNNNNNYKIDNENNNNNDNNNYKIDNKNNKSSNNSPNFPNNTKTKTKTKINENGTRSPGKTGKDLTVSEAVHLYSLLSFILTTVAHLPFDFVFVFVLLGKFGELLLFLLFSLSIL